MKNNSLAKYDPQSSKSQSITKEKPSKVWGVGTIPLNGVEIDSFVLEDGTALIGTRKILRVLGRGEKGDYANSNRPSFLAANNLQKFISDELEEKLKGVEINYNKKIFSAYHADILPLVCEVYLSARTAGVLQPRQLVIAEHCEMLVRSFARVGITALIYEQLGFEKYKHPDALRILIESYLSEEIRKWSKEFPDELFRQMDRIYGNEKTTSRNRPLYYAKFIRKYIYHPIEQGQVLRKLDERTPKDSKGRKIKRLFQSASEEIGLPAIRAQIWQVVGVLKTSPSKRNFENNYARLLGQTYQPTLFNNEE